MKQPAKKPPFPKPIAPPKFAAGGGIKVRGTGAATKGLRARGPMA